jgi:hypothetical protein
MTTDTTAPIDGADVVDTLRATVGSWKDVTTADHRFGGVEFNIGRRELGHVHAQPAGRSFADLPFPKKVRDGLIAAGRARPHHVLPDSGWVTVPVRTGADLDDVIELFRMNLDRAWTS